MNVGDSVTPTTEAGNQEGGGRPQNLDVTLEVTMDMVLVYRKAFEEFVQAGLEHARKHRTRVPADLSAQGCRRALSVTLNHIINKQRYEMKLVTPPATSRPKPAPPKSGPFSRQTRVLRSLADLKGLDNAD